MSNQPDYKGRALQICDGDPTRFRQVIIWTYAELAGTWLLLPEAAHWFKREKKVARRIGTMYMGSMTLAGGGRKQRWGDKNPDIESLLSLGKDWYGFIAWAGEQDAIKERVAELEDAPYGMAVRDEYARVKTRLLAWDKVKTELRVPKSITSLYLSEKAKIELIANQILDP